MIKIRQYMPVYVLCLERVGLIGEDESIIGEATGWEGSENAEEVARGE